MLARARLWPRHEPRCEHLNYRLIGPGGLTEPGQPWWLLQCGHKGRNDRRCGTFNDRGLLGPEVRPAAFLIVKAS